MDAGPDLDLLIAERVLDWQPLTETPEGYRWLTHTRHRRVTIEPFSTSIEAAWQVVEYLDDQDYRMSLSNFGGWHCEFMPMSGMNAVGLGLGRGAGQSAAEAICWAALAAVGGERA